LYTIRSYVIGDQQQEGVVERRYSDFSRFHDALPTGKPDFLCRRWPLFEDHFQAQFIRDRALLLEHYLRLACNVSGGDDVRTLVDRFLLLERRCPDAAAVPLGGGVQASALDFQAWLARRGAERGAPAAAIAPPQRTAPATDSIGNDEL
jgi:hypothetical protein